MKEQLRRRLSRFRTIVLSRRRVTLGRGSMIENPARIHGLLTIGTDSLVLRGLDCDGPVSVGSDTFINSYCYLRAGVVVGSHVSIASHVRLITDSHEIGPRTRRAGASTSHPITVGDGAWIGSGSTVLPGVHIGAGAVVAAGSLVTKDVPADTLVAGAPAVTVRHLPTTRQG